MDRIREGKQQEILKAAVRVFAQKGFHGAKMARIAQEAGVSAGTLYNYFSDKDHILDRIFETVCQKVCQGIDMIMVRDDFSCPEKMDAVIDLFLDALGPDLDLIVLFANEFEPRVRGEDSIFLRDYLHFKAMVIQLIQRGGDEKCFNPHIPAAIAFEFILGGLNRSLYAMARSSIPYDLGTMRRNVKGMIKKGIVFNEE